jgi:simple sugar transport system substrate-binding protein
MTVGIPDFSLVQPLAKLAADKGIPLITYNSGTSEQSKQLGALIHIGQPEYVAGKLAGERAKGLGVTHFVCVNQAVQSSQSNERCQGFADGLGIKLGDQNLDAGSDPTDIYNRVKAFLASHSETNGILTLGADVATAVMKLLADNGDAGKYKFITFDLSKDVIQAIKNGTIESAIDQQGYLQGYLSIVFLTKYVRLGVMPANDVYTGPGFVDKRNVDLVAKLAGEYR